MKFPFFEKKKLDAKNFFDLKSSERKKIIKKAVRDSTRKQVTLLKEYGYVFTRAHN